MFVDMFVDWFDDRAYVGAGIDFDVLGKIIACTF